MTRRFYGVVVVAVAASLALPQVACRKRGDPASASEAGAGAPFAVREGSEGLLLTWIDEKGDFHVEQKVGDVPLVGRDAVRVVDPTREEGTHGDRVFVADLRLAGADGAYSVREMSREEFDALAVTRRAKNAPTLAGVMSPDAAAPSESADPGDPTAAAQAAPVAGRPSVIVYGASWCGACHQAEAYFKSHGVSYIEKDIERDPQAAAEMDGKLRRARLRSGSIPVLDVRGRIMVGFDPGQVQAALGSPI